MRKIFLVLIFMAMIMGQGNLFAQRGSRTQEGNLEIKLASSLPQASPWGRTLDRIASEWSRVTHGQVQLNVRHGGIEGDESKVLLSLASNSIQAAIFSSLGLGQIYPAVMTISAPFLIRNANELTKVMNEVQPSLETGIDSGNYFIIAWSKAGFVNIFSRDPVFVPDDLKKQKIASNPGAMEMNAAFKTMGFQVLELDVTDVGIKAASGAVEATYQNPAGVAAVHLHSSMKNMLSINIAPILGGIIINQITWKKIGNLNPDYQEELLGVTRRIAGEFDDSMQKTVDDAIQYMTKEGLIINRPNPAQEQLWYDEIEKVMPSLLKTVYDRELYQKIYGILGKYRGGR